MRKLFITCLAVLFMASVAYAASIPWIVDARNQKEIWTTVVYNNSSGDLAIGDVVVWDIGSSTGDDDNYITTTTTANSPIVAGVVYPAAILDGDTGTIAIYGPVDVDYSSAETVADVVCTSGTAGEGGDCTGDYYGFGTVMEATDPGKTFIKINN